MTPNNFFVALLTFSMTLPCFASANFAMSNAEKKAALFLLHKSDTFQKNQLMELSYPGEICPTKINTECIIFVAGNYPSADEKLAATRACVGNINSECVKALAGSYPITSERVNAAKACRGNLGQDCMLYVAGSYPTTDERLQAAKACDGADAECVKYVAGSYPSSSEKITAAKACGGQ